MSITPTAASPATFATLPMAAPVPGAGAGTIDALGGRGRSGFKIDIKKLLLFGAGGALLGMLVPVIPGGPIGGAALGAALALIL